MRTMTGARVAPHAPLARSGWLLTIVVLLSALLAACNDQHPTQQLTSTPSSGFTIPGTPVPPVPPSSQELIAAALQSGRIDYGTSLMYRAYAIFGDPRLPQEFVGAGPSQDPGLVLEGYEAKDRLSADTWRQLRPFLVRPNHPDSIFTATAPSSPSTLSTALSGMARLAPAPACPQGWTSAQSSWIIPSPVKDPQTGKPVPWAKVWACDDPQAAADVNLVMGMLQQVWPAMTRFMGNPKPDGFSITGEKEDGNDSTSIDFYLISQTQSIHRFFDDRKLTGHPGVTFGYCVYEAPNCLDGVAGSGYSLLDRDRLHQDQQGFESSLVHEFFHILQYEHNFKLFGKDPNFWFYDASAKWAETWFGPNPRRIVYPLFSNLFQTGGYLRPLTFEGPDSVTADPKYQPPPHPYEAFIWPFFMQLQAPRHADAIADAWRALGSMGAETPDVANKVIDAQLSFEKNFSIFAVTNLDTALNPGDPIKPRYQDLDPAFPDGVLPSTAELEATKITPRPFTYHEKVPSLSAAYWHFETTSDVQQVTFDVSKVPPDLTVDVIGRTDEGWKWLRQSDLAKGRICGLREGYLVLSNHSLAIGSKQSEGVPIKVDVPITAKTTPCTCGNIAGVKKGWQGTFTFTLNWQEKPNGTPFTFQDSERLTLQLAPVIGGIDLTGSGVSTGTLVSGGASIFHQALTGPGSSSTWTASTPPFSQPPQLNVNWLHCHYALQFETFLEGKFTAVSPGFTYTAPWSTCINVELDYVDGNDVPELSGDMVVPVLRTNTSSNFVTCGSSPSTDATAHVTWNFAPIV